MLITLAITRQSEMNRPTTIAPTELQKHDELLSNKQKMTFNVLIYYTHSQNTLHYWAVLNSSRISKRKIKTTFRGNVHPTLLFAQSIRVLAKSKIRVLKTRKHAVDSGKSQTSRSFFLLLCQYSFAAKKIRLIVKYDWEYPQIIIRKQSH